jgi:hypothetical protein
LRVRSTVSAMRSVLTKYRDCCPDPAKGGISIFNIYWPSPFNVTYTCAIVKLIQ